MAEKATFDGINKLIIINDGETDIDVDTYIYGGWKRWLNEQNAFGLTSKYLQALRTIGGDPTVTGQYVSPYFFLLNGWRVRPYEGDHQLVLTGNLYVDGGGNPFVPTLGDYNVLVTQNVANIATATIQELEIANLQRIIETGRAHHTGTGNIWYWDPYGGDDTWAGTAQDTAFKTFAKAHDSAVSNNHDIIICVPGDPAGITTSTEAIEITKNYLFVRGPGRDFQLSPPNETLITGRGVELSSLVLDEEIKVHNDFALLKDLWIHDTTMHGICVSGSQHSRFENLYITNAGEDGIHVGSDVLNLKIGDKSTIHNCNTGVNVQGTNISGVLINADICDNSAYGIDIGPGCTCAIIDEGTTFSRNASGNIYDEGDSTAYGGDIAGDRMKDKVLDETLSLHTSAGSVADVITKIKQLANLIPAGV